MADKRTTVWVQHYADRPYLMFQWIDPETGKRKSKSAETCNPLEAEKKRSDLEYELNHGLHREPSKLTWEKFRELFEAEYVAGTRLNTQHNFTATLDAFERICRPGRLESVCERTVSQFVAGLRQEPGRGQGKDGTMQASTIKVRLQFLHTALAWAAGQKLIPAVPKFPAVKVPRKKPQPVAVEAFERMIEKAEDAQMRVYLLTGWLAGLRLTEAFLLEWEPTDLAPYLDLARNRVVLPAAYVKAVEDQWVPLDPTLRAALEALPRHGRRVFHFVSRKGIPLLPGGVSQRVRYLAKRAGVRLSMKTLRKGFGCRHAGRVSAHVLQRLMRHANIKVTLDYYASFDAAVEEAILGPQHNTQHNSGGSVADRGGQSADVTPSLPIPNFP